MAKRLAEGVYSQGGKGKKPCPFDGSHFVAARASHCPACEQDIPIKEKKEKKLGDGKKATSGVDDAWKVAKAFVNAVRELGGLAEVKKQLAALTKLREQEAVIQEKLKLLGGEKRGAGSRSVSGVCGRRSEDQVKEWGVGRRCGNDRSIVLDGYDLAETPVEQVGTKRGEAGEHAGERILRVTLLVNRKDRAVLALDLLDEQESETILNHCEEHLGESKRSLGTNRKHRLLAR